MAKPTPSSRSSSKWFWILTLLALFILAIAWFANPLGKVEQAPPPETAAQSTEWAPAPDGPAVDVKLPETSMKNPIFNQTEGTGN
ncbi:MAG: hypothetical protein AB7G25_02080 [Sphingomonadaceae bacterium]